MIRVSTIKVVFVVMLLVIVGFLFMKNNISNYYERPMTIRSTPSHHNEKMWRFKRTIIDIRYTKGAVKKVSSKEKAFSG